MIPWRVDLHLEQFSSEVRITLYLVTKKGGKNQSLSLHCIRVEMETEAIKKISNSKEK